MGILLHLKKTNSDTAGTYTVVYSVSDSSGNAADQKTRTVIVSDTTEPVPQRLSYSLMTFMLMMVQLRLTT